MTAMALAIAMCGVGWLVSYRASRNANRRFVASFLELCLATLMLLSVFLVLELLVGQGLASSFR